MDIQGLRHSGSREKIILLNVYIFGSANRIECLASHQRPFLEGAKSHTIYISIAPEEIQRVK